MEKTELGDSMSEFQYSSSPLIQNSNHPVSQQSITPIYSKGEGIELNRIDI